MPIAVCWKRLTVIAIGWLFIGFGIAGLFLPVLRGIVFLLVGLVILSSEYHGPRWLLGYVRGRFPQLDRVIKDVHERAAAILGASKETGGRT